MAGVFRVRKAGWDGARVMSTFLLSGAPGGRSAEGARRQSSPQEGGGGKLVPSNGGSGTRRRGLENAEEVGHS